jgi:hypothetical protein
VVELKPSSGAIPNDVEDYQAAQSASIFTPYKERRRGDGPRDSDGANVSACRCGALRGSANTGRLKHSLTGRLRPQHTVRSARERREASVALWIAPIKFHHMTACGRTRETGQVLQGGHAYWFFVERVEK